jgi:1-deoxy-D-xylulose-5-phosphate synthase
VVAIYSTFLQRSFDQIVHDVALQNLPVTFALDRGGLVGADGKTHQGAFDIAYLRCVPTLVVMAPADEGELRHMLATALAHDGAAALRYPRGVGVGVPVEPGQPLPIGKGRIVHAGGPKPDALVVAYGTTVHPAIAAAKALAGEGLRAVVVDARFVKPLDETLIAELAAQAGRVVTVEEGCLPGGFGSAVLEALSSRGLSVQVHRLGLPDRFVEHGSADDQRAAFGLDAAGIARAVRELCAPRAEPARAGVQAG